MKPGRAFSFLAGIMLLGVIADFNEMTPEARASLLGAATETARETAQSWLSGAVATWHGLTDGITGTVPPPSARVTAALAPAAGSEKRGTAPLRHMAARTPDGTAEPPFGNPLWALPLKQLSSTRERPIFSPSRRPPPPATPTYVAPVAVREPVKPPEARRPTVSLLGTVIGTGPDDRIGVFLETGTQKVIRMRIGEDHQGWVLRQIEMRQATLVKNGEPAAVLEMPPPGKNEPPGGNRAASSRPQVPAALDVRLRQLQLQRRQQQQQRGRH